MTVSKQISKKGHFPKKRKTAHQPFSKNEKGAPALFTKILAELNSAKVRPERLHFLAASAFPAQPPAAKIVFLNK
jgi:hypothetical protein